MKGWSLYAIGLGACIDLGRVVYDTTSGGFATGASCSTSSQCESNNCLLNACAAPSCTDSLKNGNETDIDCGGGCPACPAGASCRVSSDCVDQQCTNAVCAVVVGQCTDGITDGDETDVDCGGSCKACATGSACSKALDCVTQLCIGKVCTTAGCSDGVKDGNETAVDCGGSCPSCANGEACGQAADCQSGVCATVCQAPTCSDGVKNQDETGVDCGGSCPVSCAAGQGCGVAGDCWNNDCVSGTCTSTCGPDMATITQSISTTTTFCIDTTEVRWGDYLAWLNRHPSLFGRLSECSWNTTFDPRVATSAPNGCPISGATYGLNRPVSCVDWCDAAAYCSDHRRHLCGEVGGGSVLFGPSSGPGDRNTTQDQWYYACTNGTDATTYCYGNTAVTRTCNDSSGSGAVWDVGSVAACQTEKPTGIFDLTGNVAEWEDSCESTADTSLCAERGGSFALPETSMPCSATFADPRATVVNRVGFRCCAN